MFKIIKTVKTIEHGKEDDEQKIDTILSSTNKPKFRR